jgi:peptidylprolyl isomerase
MRTSLWILGWVLLLVVSCKDTTETVNQESVVDQEQLIDKETQKEIDLEEFYKPMMTEDGDTLLSFIPQDSVRAFFTRYGNKNPETRVRMSTRFGDIDIELFEETPIYRASFIWLVKNNYYDQTVVHRVVPRFVVQAGDSDSRIIATKRTSAGNYKLEPNFLPDVKHAYGTVSAAKQWEDNPENWHNPFDFFISLRATNHLDGEHTIFGRVVSGMDVAEKISRVDRDEGDWPIQDIYLDMSVIK